MPMNAAERPQQPHPAGGTNSGSQTGVTQAELSTQGPLTAPQGVQEPMNMAIGQGLASGNIQTNMSPSMFIDNVASNMRSMGASETQVQQASTHLDMQHTAVHLNNEGTLNLATASPSQIKSAVQTSWQADVQEGSRPEIHLDNLRQTPAPQVNQEAVATLPETAPQVDENAGNPPPPDGSPGGGELTGSSLGVQAGEMGQGSGMVINPPTEVNAALGQAQETLLSEGAIGETMHFGDYAKLVQAQMASEGVPPSIIDQAGTYMDFEHTARALNDAGTIDLSTARPPQILDAVKSSVEQEIEVGIRPVEHLEQFEKIQRVQVNTQAVQELPEAGEAPAVDYTVGELPPAPPSVTPGGGVLSGSEMGVQEGEMGQGEGMILPPQGEIADAMSQAQQTLTESGAISPGMSFTDYSKHMQDQMAKDGLPAPQVQTAGIQMDVEHTARAMHNDGAIDLGDASAQEIKMAVYETWKQEMFTGERAPQHLDQLDATRLPAPNTDAVAELPAQGEAEPVNPDAGQAAPEGISPGSFIQPSDGPPPPPEYMPGGGDMSLTQHAYPGGSEASGSDIGVTEAEMSPTPVFDMPQDIAEPMTMAIGQGISAGTIEAGMDPSSYIQHVQYNMHALGASEAQVQTAGTFLDTQHTAVSQHNAGNIDLNEATPTEIKEAVHDVWQEEISEGLRPEQHLDNLEMLPRLTPNPDSIAELPEQGECPAVDADAGAPPPNSGYAGGGEATGADMGVQAGEMGEGAGMLLPMTPSMQEAFQTAQTSLSESGTIGEGMPFPDYVKHLQSEMITEGVKPEMVERIGTHLDAEHTMRALYDGGMNVSGMSAAQTKAAISQAWDSEVKEGIRPPEHMNALSEIKIPAVDKTAVQELPEQGSASGVDYSAGMPAFTLPAATTMGASESSGAYLGVQLGEMSQGPGMIFDAPSDIAKPLEKAQDMLYSSGTIEEGMRFDSYAHHVQNQMSAQGLAPELVEKAGTHMDMVHTGQSMHNSGELDLSSSSPTQIKEAITQNWQSEVYLGQRPPEHLAQLEEMPAPHVNSEAVNALPDPGEAPLYDPSAGVPAETGYTGEGYVPPTDMPAPPAEYQPEGGEFTADGNYMAPPADFADAGGTSVPPGYMPGGMPGDRQYQEGDMDDADAGAIQGAQLPDQQGGPLEDVEL